MRTSKIVRAFSLIIMLAVLSACSGQTPAPTPTAVDVNAIITAAASTAYAQLTQIASLATPTLAPTEAPTQAPAAATTDTGAAAAATQPLVIQITITSEAFPTVVTAQGTPSLPSIPALPSLTPVPTIPLGGAVATSSGPLCKNATFMGDVTIPDGTTFKAWEKFTKIWAIKNTGTCTWDEGFSFRMYAGANMGGDNYYITKESQFIKAGETVNMGIKMFAPGDPGEYVSHWAMFDDQNKAFGGDFTVVIKVVK